MNGLALFKQQLADELNAHAVSLPNPTPATAGHRARPRVRTARRRVVFTVGVAAAAAAVAVALPLSSGHRASQDASVPRSTASTGGTSDAPSPQRSPSFSGLDVVNADYAVQSKPGGMVTVQLFSLKGLPGLQASLNKAGIPAAVVVASASCHDTGRTDSSPHTGTGQDSGSALYHRLLRVLPPSASGSSYNNSDGVHNIYPGAMAPGDHLLFIATSTSAPLTSLMVELVRQVPSCIAPRLEPAP